MDRANLEGQRILVVEEQPLVALDLKLALEQAGAQVVVAGNAAEALGRVSQFDFTAGVVDWRPQSDDHRVVARASEAKEGAFSVLRYEPA